MGIYGNTQAEAICPGYQVGSDGRPLDASTGGYTLRFEPGKVPPANALWSVTMCDGPNKLLVTNPIDRHLISSPMPPQKGPFFAVMRSYWPKPEALDGTWKQPPLARVP